MQELVFDWYEKDIQPIEMEHLVKSSRRKLWELKDQLKEVEQELRRYENSTHYMKSMTRAKEAGLL